MLVILYILIEMTNLNNALQKEYIQRINLALQFIDTQLDSELSLENVSQVALYSPFHFHRMFKAIIGETLNAYVNRRRIEKAAAILMHKEEVTITELSSQYGFTSNSSFTRAFKKFYGLNPSNFRQQQPHKFSKIRQVESKNGQENLVFESYICNINDHINWIKMNASIEVKEIPDLKFAGITHIGVNGLENTFEKLIKWAKPKGYLANPATRMGRIFYDSFKITAANKVRMNICMLLNEPFTTEGEITSTHIKKGRYIISRLEITADDFEKSWTALFIWMNENGYNKSEKNPFEIYHNDFRKHPDNKFIVDLYIPID